jgi:hypothetical protein
MSLKKDIKQIEKEIVKDIHYAERWVLERRKFLIKLLGVMGFIVLLLILLNFL